MRGSRLGIRTLQVRSPIWRRPAAATSSRRRPRAPGRIGPELAKAIRRLEAGDVLVVTRLDRRARSTRDLLNILDAVGKAGAGFKSLKERGQIPPRLIAG
jgi:DNA invertase Pin-like site-specific DNA recombinase